MLSPSRGQASIIWSQLKKAPSSRWQGLTVKPLQENGHSCTDDQKRDLAPASQVTLAQKLPKNGSQVWKIPQGRHQHGTCFGPLSGILSNIFWHWLRNVGPQHRARGPPHPTQQNLVLLGQLRSSFRPCVSKGAVVRRRPQSVLQERTQHPLRSQEGTNVALRGPWCRVDSVLSWSRFMELNTCLAQPSAVKNT